MSIKKLIYLAPIPERPSKLTKRKVLHYLSKGYVFRIKFHEDSIKDCYLNINNDIFIENIIIDSHGSLISNFSRTDVEYATSKKCTEIDINSLLYCTIAIFKVTNT